MSLALVEQLNFEKQMPIDGNCKQQIAISVPSTGASSYYLASYFMINIPRAGPDYVFDPMNSFLRFKATIADQAGVLSIDHSATVQTRFARNAKFYMLEMYLRRSIIINN